MIYVILTASLTNRLPSLISENRLERYRYAITETLSLLPDGVQPIIVENSGKGSGFSKGTSFSKGSSFSKEKDSEWGPHPLDGFVCNGRSVPVIQTNHGELSMRNKGVNEWLDIKAVMDHMGLQEEDIVVKLTGRYRLLSSWFLDVIRQTVTQKDAWFRHLNVCTGEEDPMDCVLGCYAARVSVLRCLSWSWLNLFDSPEQAMARFIRSSVSEERHMTMDRLDVECVFSDTGRVLCV